MWNKTKLFIRDLHFGMAVLTVAGIVMALGMMLQPAAAAMEHPLDFATVTTVDVQGYVLADVRTAKTEVQRAQLVAFNNDLVGERNPWFTYTSKVLCKQLGRDWNLKGSGSGHDSGATTPYCNQPGADDQVVVPRLTSYGGRF